MSAYNFVRSGPSSQIFLFNDGKIVLVNAALSGLFCADVPLINYSLTYFVLTIDVKKRSRKIFLKNIKNVEKIKRSLKTFNKKH